MAEAADGEAGRLATLMQVVHAITAASTDYDRLLEVAARETALATATCCSIRLLSDDRRRLELAASFDPDPAWLARFLEVMGRRPIEVERSRVAAQVLRDLAPVAVPDVRGAPAGAFAAEVRAAMAALDMRTLLMVPLAVHGEVIGVFALSRHGERAAPHDRCDVDLAQVIADHAALSISNARLYAEAGREMAERSLREYARRLEERTRELESANHELDSFSYSVSHDLRAPLRAIDGFSRILAEEHGAALDDEGLRILGVIRGNARKMAELIDDLLAFSRLGRKQLTLSLVDMDGMVRAIAAEVAGAEPGRSIELRIARLPPAAADPALVTQVWVNLISNAVKYTRGRPGAIISIEGAEEADQVTYRIADNGVGFDMRYAHKLFGVFQRLHAASEFEGTGVGLALVRRIVIRHGGWISADGRPGEGATFEFALPRRERW